MSRAACGELKATGRPWRLNYSRNMMEWSGGDRILKGEEHIARQKNGQFTDLTLNLGGLHSSF